MILKTPPIENMTGAFDVSGKNVVITGGNRGIGLGIAQAFAQSGANVAIACRDTAGGEKAAAGLARHGGMYACFECDVSSNDSVKSAAAKIFESFGNIDVLINNAGVASTTEFLSDNGLKEWHRIIDTNLHGVANVIHAIAPNMRDSGRGGSIINISSISGQRVSYSRNHHNPPYNVSKAGVDIFTRYLAIVLGDYGIRVNSISPGFTHSSLDDDLPPDVFEMVERELPTHRFGEPIEIGALCIFLASPAGCHMTGNIIEHDGGVTCII